MIPVEKVQLIINKYETLEKELASGNIDKKDFVKKSKEYSRIGEIIKEARGYVSFKKEKEELSKIIDEQDGDKEMVNLATKELNSLLTKQEANETMLKIYLLPKDEADGKNAILENKSWNGRVRSYTFLLQIYIKCMRKFAALKGGS